MTTSNAVEAAVRASVAILEAVVDLGSIPSGHLYAQLMGRMSLENYNAIINGLVKAGMLTDRGHLLEPTAKGRELIAVSRS